MQKHQFVPSAINPRLNKMTTGVGRNKVRGMRTPISLDERQVFKGSSKTHKKSSRIKSSSGSPANSSIIQPTADIVFPTSSRTYTDKSDQLAALLKYSMLNPENNPRKNY